MYIYTRGLSHDISSDGLLHRTTNVNIILNYVETGIFCNVKWKKKQKNYSYITMIMLKKKVINPLRKTEKNTRKQGHPHLEIENLLYPSIHSSINRYLGCFYVLGIVNSATLNMRVHISFQINVYQLPFLYI